MSNVLTADRKPNPRQMTFIDYIIAGETEVKAYQLAGYAGEPHTLYGPASRLLSKVNIQAELAKRRLESTKAKGIDLNTIVSELETNASLARDAGQFGASNQAWALIGKALGLIIERSESKTTSTEERKVTIALDGMDDSQLAALITGIRQQQQSLPEASPKVIDA